MTHKFTTEFSYLTFLTFLTNTSHIRVQGWTTHTLPNFLPNCVVLGAVSCVLSPFKGGVHYILGYFNQKFQNFADQNANLCYLTFIILHKTQ